MTRTPLKNSGEPRRSGRVSSCCSTSDTRPLLTMAVNRRVRASIRYFQTFLIRYFYLFRYCGIKHNIYITRCSCNLTVTRLVRLVEQELPTLPEHLNSSPVFSGVRVVPIVHCHVFTVPCCDVRFICFIKGSCLCYLYLHILESNTIMFVSFNSNTTGASSRAGTAYPSGAYESNICF